MNLTYEVNENGYVIFNNGRAWIVQDGYFPFEGDTLADKAQAHINAILSEQQDQEEQVSDIEILKSQNAQIILALVEGGMM